MKKNNYYFVVTLIIGGTILGGISYVQAQGGFNQINTVNTNGQTNNTITNNSSLTNTTQVVTDSGLKASDQMQTTNTVPGGGGGQQQAPVVGGGGGPQQTTTTSTTTDDGIGKVQNPINVTDLSSFVAKVLGIILKIAIPIVAAFIIYSGLMFVLARGNSEKLEKAKTRLLYTLIGAGILLGAWMIATVIKATIEALTA